MATTINLPEARARFGELLDQRTRTYKHFETPDGDWRPVYDEDVKITGYRLYPKLRTKPVVVPYRPKR